MTRRRVWTFVAAFIALASCTSNSEVIGQRSNPAPQVTITQTVTHTPIPATVPPRLPVGCRSTDPQAGVANPAHYEVLSGCKIAKGLVVMSRPELDGTHLFGIDLNAELEWLLDDGNRASQGGLLIARIVSADLRGCNAGCSGASLVAPIKGDYIEFSGPLVWNKSGWREIHPVWRWVMLKASPTRSIAPAQAAIRPPIRTRPAAPNPACHPSYRGACLRTDGDYDCREGSGNGPYYTGEVEVVGPDEYDLDRDGDGVGCEGQ